MTFDRPDNPFYFDLPLRHAWSAPVLGVPVRLRSNAESVIAAAEASFGAWHALKARPDLVEARSADVRLVVHDGYAGPAGVEYRRPDPRTVVLLGAGGGGYADASTGTALAYVSPAAVAEVEQFRYLVLEALVLFLLTGRDRHPVHASAAVRDGVAVLFAGAGGLGKSTLAYAASRAGWTVLSDDVVYVQSAPVWRIWGGPGARSYVPPDAARFFPELRALTPELRANGRERLAVTRASVAPPVCERAVLCLLERGRGGGSSPRLEPIAADAAMAVLAHAPESGFDVFAEQARERLTPLAARAWRLCLGDDPRDVVPLLERAVQGAGG